MSNKKKRTYYRIGKTHLNDRLHSSYIEFINEQTKKLLDQQDEDRMKELLAAVQDPEYFKGVLEEMSKDIINNSREDVY